MTMARAGLPVLILGWLCLAVPTLWDFLFGVWSGFSQGHELLLLSVAGWLVWRHRSPDDAAPQGAWPAWFWLAWGLGVLAYAFGRSQEFIRIELLSVWWLAMLLTWLARGWVGLRRTWFAWLFCLFAMPLPFGLVLMLTAPLKEAVSALAAGILSSVGYPIGRSGVVLTVGQYQLLVAEACAGLHSMFILEAMGLLYSHLAQHTSWWRNGLLAVLAVPVSFLANVVRVMVLVVVTHHFGDAAGQGFVHNFAGLVLFAVALVLMESPAILMAMALASWARRQEALGAAAHGQVGMAAPSIGHVVREAFTDGANLLLLGSLAIGFVTGEQGKAMMEPFSGALFKGMLALFLLDLGLLVARQLPALRTVHPALLLYGVCGPLVHGLIAMALAALLHLSAGDAILLVVLAASSSYIVVPAVLRHAIPEAKPSLYLGLSLAVTFVFNILFGIPLYTGLAQYLLD